MRVKMGMKLEVGVGMRTGMGVEALNPIPNFDAISTSTPTACNL